MTSRKEAKKQKTDPNPRPKVARTPVAEADRRRSSRIAQIPAPLYNLEEVDRSIRYVVPFHVAASLGLFRETGSGVVGSSQGQVGVNTTAAGATTQWHPWQRPLTPGHQQWDGRNLQQPKLTPRASSISCTPTILLRTPRSQIVSEDRAAKRAKSGAARVGGSGGSRGGWHPDLGDCSLQAAEAATEAAVKLQKELEEKGKLAAAKVGIQ